MSDDEDDDDIDDLEVFDISSVKFSFWQSKDRRRAVIELRDSDPLNDMKIYLALEEKRLQMERSLGILESNEETH